MAKETNEFGGRPRVFVYGTLKSGEPNHCLLEADDSKLLGDYTLVGPYRMVDLGYYPGVVRDSSITDGVVVGEVYEVSMETLFSLDLLEGHPDYYARTKVPTDFKNAWVYLLPAQAVEGCDTIESGVWNG